MRTLIEFMYNMIITFTMSEQVNQQSFEKRFLSTHIGEVNQLHYSSEMPLLHIITEKEDISIMGEIRENVMDS